MQNRNKRLFNNITITVKATNNFLKPNTLKHNTKTPDTF